MGKTWLALHWAHLHVKQFPDGQLFVDLRGFDPTGEPMPPMVAVRSFLDALGMESAAIPVDLDAQVGLYRSLVADRRMLIVLDNARDTAQVTHLLPGTAACTVLVTSRRYLAGLITNYGARSLDLDVLSEPEARQLLTDHVGPERVAAEQDASAELLKCCAGLPLALVIVAARATAHPDFPLSLLAEELRDHATRLAGFDAGEIPLNLRSVFSSSYSALSGKAATLFELLGPAPGPDISLAAAGSLIGLPIYEVKALLRELESAHLVAQSVPDRYHLHDLLRLYAVDQVSRDQSHEDIETALQRLVEFYLHTAHIADRLIDPGARLISTRRLPACRPRNLPNARASLAWFDAEHPCLLAAHRLAVDHGWHSLVWQLAWTMDTFHRRRGHLHDRFAIWQVSLVAANHDGDQAGILLAYHALGHAFAFMDKHLDALDYLNRALKLTQDGNDRFAEAGTRILLGQVHAMLGDDQKALAGITTALHLYRAVSQPVGEAVALNAMGWLSTRLGHYQRAHTYCHAALALFRRYPYPHGEANTLDSLGELAQLIGQHAQALEYFQQALMLYREFGTTYDEADTLNHLGHAHAALGDHDQALDVWHKALRLYRNQNRMAEAEYLRRQMDGLDGQE